MSAGRSENDQLVDAVLGASRALVAVAARSLDDLAEDVTLAQYRTLVELAAHGPQRVAQLAAVLGVERSTATRMCDRLVRKRLIQRRRESRDRRAVQVALTGEGRTVIDRVTHRRREEITGILELLAPRDRAAVLRALRAFADAAGTVPEQDWSLGWDLAPEPQRQRQRREAEMTSRRLRQISAWLAASKLGLLAMALFVGALAGLGAAAFRALIYLFTFVFTGRNTFGEQGHAASLHVPFIGAWFVLITPVIAGLVYGPLIHRFAREARGHGVPEVMLAVAENGGRIRPPVTIVKALASALCIGGGGSVGREGPIVQIGSALASTLGQLVQMSEGRLRVIVACGAAGGIAATFNAPLTGMFFGFEIVLREFSLDALAATILSAVTADVISRAFFGGAPFFAAVPHDLSVTNDITYLLIALLGVAAGLIGVAFQKILYKGEDVSDALWGERPAWLRPVAGGLLLGLVLLALPQMYGVGYPVMDRVFGGHYVLWFVAILLVGKILAASLTLWIGGSGGVFAPSLFIGAAAGTAFGTIVHHLFGPAVGPPALYGVVAMGGVFAAAAQAPLTAIASVAEMTGNFTLTLPIMLACGTAALLAKRITHGSIYTTKLLRRGIDIERPKALGALQALTVEEVMQPLGSKNGSARPFEPAAPDGQPEVPEGLWERLIGPVTLRRRPQALFAEEDLEQARRQLVLYGRDGLPVVTHDGHLRGWLTRADLLKALTAKLNSDEGEATEGALAAEFAREDPLAAMQTPSTPLRDYEILEVRILADSAARGHRVGEIEWPPGCIVAAVTQDREIHAGRPDIELQPGERVIVLAPARAKPGRDQPHERHDSRPSSRGPNRPAAPRHAG